MSAPAPYACCFLMFSSANNKSTTRGCACHKNKHNLQLKEKLGLKCPLLLNFSAFNLK